MQGKLGMNLREWRVDTILDAGGNRSTRRKPARASIDWEPNSHTTHLARLEIEPGPHWWKAREQPLRQPACPNNHSLAIFVSPELSSKRDYVITHCVRSMYVVCSVYVVLVCSMYVYVCAILQNWSLYPHTLMYSHGTWTQGSLGHTCDLNRLGDKGHLGVHDLWFKFLKKRSLYPHTLTYFHGTWIKWSLGKVTHVTSTEVGSKVILG